MKFPIALQLFSIRDSLEQDFKGTLQKVKGLGFDGVEFAGLYDNQPEDIRDMLKEIGLTAVSAHVPFVDLVADPKKVVADYATIGCQYVVIPYLTEEYRPGQAKFQEVIDGAKVIGQAAKDAGMTLLYHNHDFEFEKIDGEYALDVLYATVPAELLETEIDTCWVNVAGENPAEYVKKYAGRAPIVHLKDFFMPEEKPEKLYDLIGIDEDQGDSGAFEFRPLGGGMQDIPSILTAAETAGSKWVVVEQDEPSAGKTRFECVEESMRYLKTL